MQAAATPTTPGSPVRSPAMLDPAPRWFEIRGQRVRIPEHVVFRVLARETILLNVQSGQYHSVDGVGTAFFAELRDAATIEVAAAALAGTYEQPVSVIQNDLAVFVDQLAGLGLVELEPAA